MSWLHEAACKGEDPAVFDHYVFPQAKKALQICGGCHFIDECLAWVRPNKSFYDGVAAGIAWRNGYRVRPDNTTREDRFIRIRFERGESVEELPELYGQGTLPFD